MEDNSLANANIYPLIINSTNLVSSNSYNNQYRYVFPAGSIKFNPGAKISVGSISMFYSWYNITSSYSNNSFQIIWPIGGSTTTYTITLPNGSYQISDINSYIQQFCISNGLYLINSSGNYVYYIELITNSVYYSVQLNTYSIPTSLPTGYTAPSNWVGYPSTAYTPQLIVQNNNFTSTIGFNAGTYPAAQQTSTYSKISSFTPEVSPVQSVILTCSLLNNVYNINPKVLYTFTPAGVNFGSTIDSSPNYPMWVNVQNGVYSYIDFFFIDQNYNNISLNDTNYKHNNYVIN